jgi:hypothetical protein
MTRETNRRTFLRQGSGLVLGLGAGLALPLPSWADPELQFVDARQYLSEILYTKQEVDDWLAGHAFPFSRYHPKYGWLLNNARFRDGIDDSWSIYTYEGKEGPRLVGNYHDIPCRINTYGNSFTQCHQVSDHETWQEVLAAHLQEPVRNYGIGGWSVYQAYLRMLDVESRSPSELIIFNIYEDDHKRNLDAWRNIRVRKHPQHIEAPLPYLKVNLENDTVTGQDNPCPTEASLYDLCDLEKTLALFEHDFVMNIMIAHRNAETQNPDIAYRDLLALIRTHGIKTRLDETDTLSEQAEKIHQEAALFSSLKLLDKIVEFRESYQKKILFVLSYPPRSISRYLETGTRPDRSFIDALEAKQLPYVDLLQVHIDDFSKFNCDISSYLARYFIGHYNPHGNFFCACALKDQVVRMLDPKPVPYRN